MTPAHDFNDYAVGQRHNLPLINILNLDGNINENGTELMKAWKDLLLEKKL